MSIERSVLEEKFLGCILGLAVGDALGMPTEFLSIDAIYERFGPEGVADFVDGSHPAGTFTDDTQMSLAIANALIRVGEQQPIQEASIDAIMAEVSREFVAWAFGPENNRSPGLTCMKGCGNLKEGMSWRESGVAGSKGCGTAMRSAPVGLVYHCNHEKLKDVSTAASAATHGHHCALAGGIATAYLVALGISNTAPDKYVEMLCDFTGDVSDEFERKIRQVPGCLTMESREAFEILGGAWVAEEAVADALYCFLRSPADFRKTVLTGANSNGDSDSIACIAGAISGAYNGVSAIPEPWIERVEKAKLLRETALKLVEIAAAE